MDQAMLQREGSVTRVYAVAVIAAVSWFVLLGDDPSSWIIGVPCVLLCALFMRSVPPVRRLRVSLSGWIRLLPYFVLSSAVGGWDVARRVLTPTPAVKPGFITFALRIAPGPARNFFVQFIGLLPGTLGVWLEGDSLTVHVLNLDADSEPVLRRAEDRVASAFAIQLGA